MGERRTGDLNGRSTTLGVLRKSRETSGHVTRVVDDWWNDVQKVSRR